MKRLSLRLRITLLISAVLLCGWGITTAITYYELHNSLRRVFDSQQLLFAKRLAIFNPHSRYYKNRTQPPPPLPRTLPPLRVPPQMGLNYDDDALAFAIFTRAGVMLLNDGESGQYFQYQNVIFTADSDMTITETPKWRILWLLSHDRKVVIAVGQKLRYQRTILNDLMLKQFLPWLLTFLSLIIIIVYMISREFRPLKQLAGAISQRSPEDASPIVIDQHIPKEAKPFVQALNSLFLRASQVISRERQLTSDAAHELRTPLAALKVQTEVALLSDDDPQARRHALNNLQLGIDRTTHLVDQLLTLSRLDSLEEDSYQQIAWHQLLQQVIDELKPLAQQQQISIDLSAPAKVMINGSPLLLAILVRNLLINSIRYIPAGSQIKIALTTQQLSVCDNGPGVAEETLSRLGERFYRPPGQAVSGSGLGLSIVKKICQLHHFQVQFANITPHGFAVTINFADAEA